MKRTPEKSVRCAIYTRKSTEEGLDQDFNTLDAQRESGEAYIASQKNEGWMCLPDLYDDGGFSGGNIERPALKRLLADINAGRVDCIVVYKVDRLSRSLMDFSRMMSTFEEHEVSFVSVTQQFNTTHSMGRLTLNILLSFAQFEREIISERTRDKIAAARRRGKWAGGRPVLGYDLVPGPGGSKLIVNEKEADMVRSIFDMYIIEGSLLRVATMCGARGLTTKRWTTKAGKPQGGRALDKGGVFKMLTNVVYLGQVRHHKDVYEGEHDAIVEREVFDRVQSLLKRNGRRGGSLARNKHGALLKGLVRCGACGCAMSHHFASKATSGRGATRYRYYVCGRAQKQGWASCPCPSLPAADLEAFVVDQVRAAANEEGALAAIVTRAMEILTESATRRRAERDALARNASSETDRRRLAALERRIDEDGTRLIDADEMVGAVESFDPLWEAMVQGERESIIRALVERVEYDAEGESISVTMRDLECGVRPDEATAA